MVRLKLTAFALFSLLFSQIVFSQNPALRWVKEVDASGTDSFAGLGVDAQGNTYIAGSTYSANFPVKAAVQNHLASDGLYRIDGTGSAYVQLGLLSASSIVVDPLNANTLYATSSGKLLRSTDGGQTFSTLTLPSSSVFVLAINPANDLILYAGTFDQGVLKSTRWRGYLERRQWRPPRIREPIYDVRSLDRSHHAQRVARQHRRQLCAERRQRGELADPLFLHQHFERLF